MTTRRGTIALSTANVRVGWLEFRWNQNARRREQRKPSTFGVQRLVTAFFFKSFGAGNDVRLCCELHLKLKLNVDCFSTPIAKSAV